MTSSESKEPKGSERSSSELFAPGAEAYYRKVLKLDEPEKPALMCTCGHSRNWHPRANGYACMGDNCLDCAEFTCDHTRCGWKPREEPKRLSLTAVCACSHVNNWHVRADHSDTHCAASDCPCGAFRASPEGEECPHGVHSMFDPCPGDCTKPMEDEEPPPTPEEEAHDFSSPSHCKACMKTWIGRGVAAMENEPPLTPEEEEEFGDCPGFPECPSPGSCPACSAPEEKPPPQPERRPPYAVAYSVQGHLFEVALPGDASIRAVDGALVIQHHLGPVAGIVSVLPVINKESDG